MVRGDVGSNGIRDPVGVGAFNPHLTQGVADASQPWAKIRDAFGVNEWYGALTQGVAETSQPWAKIRDAFGVNEWYGALTQGVAETAQPWAKIRDAFGVNEGRNGTWLFDPKGVAERAIFRDPVGVGGDISHLTQGVAEMAQPWAKIRDAFGVNE